jgi:hypothetical protein
MCAIFVQSTDEVQDGMFLRKRSVVCVCIVDDMRFYVGTYTGVLLKHGSNLEILYGKTVPDLFFERLHCINKWMMGLLKSMLGIQMPVKLDPDFWPDPDP